MFAGIKCFQKSLIEGKLALSCLFNEYHVKDKINHFSVSEGKGLNISNMLTEWSRQAERPRHHTVVHECH